MTQISELVAEAGETARAHGFWDANNENIGTSLMLIVTEIAEAMEEYRTGQPLSYYSYDHKGKPIGFAVELADAIIRILDLAGQHKLDIEGAIYDKMAYNRTREHMHGKIV